MKPAASIIAVLAVTFVAACTVKKPPPPEPSPATADDAALQTCLHGSRSPDDRPATIQACGVAVESQALMPAQRLRALKARAGLYELSRKYQDAINDYTRLVRDNPRDDVALKSLGDLFRQTGKCALSVPYYDRAVRVNPKYEEAYAGRGDVNLCIKDDQNAISDYTQAL
ncbi:MAG TPA: tetratricopeptide repeat protein, partial [Rhodopila sp.]|uniref:tetratricopeptide repeat protein n=1 Tax=Rhodopila sp. TaxID=2480087 RepID=UPI002CC85D21